MKPTLFVIAGSLLISSLAVAQPEEPVGDPDGETPVVADDPPPPPPPPRPVIVREQPAPPPGPTRPPGFSIGIGFGYRLPTEVDLPNVTSVRVRLASGLTFEPFLALVNDTLSADNGVSEMEDVSSEVGFGALMRYPLRTRGRVDFDLVGGAALALTTDNPDGDRNTVRTTVFGLDYGLGLDYWVNSHWNLSMTATNPLVSLISQSGETVGADVDQTRRQLGLIFDPRVAVMLHLHL